MVWRMNMLRLSCFLGIGLAACGCSGMFVDIAADALAGDGQTYASDDDPELVRDALPFALKTTEGLLATEPDNTKLLLAAASGFTQYAYAFIQSDAEQLDQSDPKAALRIFARARRMYARARRYGMRGLSALHPGFAAAFAKDRKAAVARLEASDVAMIYWTAAPWAAQISISKDDPQLIAELPSVEALMGRALALDEAWGHGAIHEFYVAYDAGRSEASGGGRVRAKKHFDRALELSHGKKLAPLVTWAEQVAVQAQDRKLFDRMLGRVLAFDADSAPEFRLANLIAQRQARRLEARAGDLFLEE